RHGVRAAASAYSESIRRSAYASCWASIMNHNIRVGTLHVEGGSMMSRTRLEAATVGIFLVATVGLGAGQNATSGTRSSVNRSGVPRTSWGAPDLQGVWSTATVTPFERPKEFADKETLTEHEAAEYAKHVTDARNVDLRRQVGQNSDVTSAYNDAWYDRGTRVIPTRRTS